MPALLFFTIVLITGCANHQTTRFHILSANGVDTHPLNIQSENTLSVGLREVKLPAYLDRPQIVTRIGTNELVLSYANQWAEPISQSIVRVLTEQLQSRLPIISVSSYPWPLTRTLDAEIQVNITQFEIVDNQHCILDVNWIISTTPKQTNLNRYSAIINISVTQNSYHAFVTAQSGALTQLSAEIADSLSTLISRGRQLTE